MINLGWGFDTPLVDLARQHQTPSPYQPNIVWLPQLLSGFITEFALLLSLAKGTVNLLPDTAGVGFILLV